MTMWGATQIHGNFYPEELMQPKRELRGYGGLLEGCKAVCHPQLSTQCCPFLPDSSHNRCDYHVASMPFSLVALQHSSYILNTEDHYLWFSYSRINILKIRVRLIHIKFLLSIHPFSGPPAGSSVRAGLILSYLCPCASSIVDYQTTQCHVSAAYLCTRKQTEPKKEMLPRQLAG